MPTSFNYGRINSFQKLKTVIRSFHVYINPVIKWKSKETVVMSEYCLSIGEKEWAIRRPERVEVEYYTPEGNLKQEKLDKTRSRVMQHEIDHLDGILMTSLPDAIPVDQLQKDNRANRGLVS